MKIKSYFSKSVEEAMVEARRELGPEAMLVNSRKAPEEAQGLGEYEVVFAVDGSGVSETSSAASGNSFSGVFGERLSSEVAALKRELEGMRRALTRSVFTPPWQAQSPELTEAYAALTANDVGPELAREILEAASDRIRETPEPAGQKADRAPRRGLERALELEIESRIRVESKLGNGDSGPRIVALVGPPGSGKTTTLVKLAVNYALVGRRPSLLLSVDNYRVAASEQLRSYAAILGIGFQVLDTIGALSQAIEENRGKEFIFIDTPGFAFGDMDQAGPLARLLTSRNEIDSHLVLPCSMKPADLSRVVNAFGQFQPRRLLFTKLDETAAYGPVLNEAVRTGKPLSFFTTGQRIPEDIEAVTRERVARLVLAGSAERALSAA
jgi:flagellar biosynthesis protein FlhF